MLGRVWLFTVLFLVLALASVACAGGVAVAVPSCQNNVTIVRGQDQYAAPVNVRAQNVLVDQYGNAVLVNANVRVEYRQNVAVVREVHAQPVKQVKQVQVLGPVGTFFAVRNQNIANRVNARNRHH